MLGQHIASQSEVIRAIVSGYSPCCVGAGTVVLRGAASLKSTSHAHGHAPNATATKTASLSKDRAPKSSRPKTQRRAELSAHSSCL